MLKEVSKKTKTMVMVIAIVTILTITGITYAYFSAGGVSGNSGTNNVLVQTAEHGDIIVRYDGGKNTISSTNMVLEQGGDNLYDYIKYSVEYTGNVAQDTYMYFKDVTNTFCQYASGQTCTNDDTDTYVGDEYTYTTYYCDTQTKYNNITSATDTDLSSCTIINTEHTAMPKTGAQDYLSTNKQTYNNASTKYYIVVARLENKVTEQNYNQNKTFTGKVYVDVKDYDIFTLVANNSYENTNALGYKILTDPNVTKSTATPTLTKAATTQDYITTNSLSTNNYAVENGIYQTTDDDGTTYFYRGHVENNYVKFAGFIWRIVRINGDGSIRIVLDGLTSTVKKEGSEDYAGSDAQYNNDNYGTGTGPSNAANEETTAIEYASYDGGNLEGAMKTFYETYIYNTGSSIDYSGFLADSTFCSDTSWGTTSGSSWYFSPYTRLTSGTSTLTCVSDYRYKVANNKLQYPIATLSSDEINYAGAGGGTSYYKTNQNYYLYNSTTTNTLWWTMSPDYWTSDGSVLAFYVYSDGYLYSGLVVDYSVGVRPVVNLKAETLTTTGYGTSDHPYEVILINN